MVSHVLRYVFRRNFVVLDSRRFEIFVLRFNVFKIFNTLDGVGFNLLISGTSFGFGLVIN